MEKIGVKNFRSLRNISNIDIKPITVLVGKNSSGKSSFIRIIPLIKQSIETKISEPLLWYGNFVDLGDFEECLSKGKNTKTDEIEFSFSIVLRKNTIRIIRRRLFYDELEKDVHIELKISIGQNLFKSVEINFFDQNIKIKYGKNDIVESVLVNGSSVLDELIPNKKFYREPNTLIPTVNFIDERGHFQRLGSSRYWGPAIFEKEIVKKFKEKAYRTTNEENIYKISQRISIGSKENVLNYIKQLKFPSKLYQELQNLEIDEEYFKELNNLIIANSVEEIIEMVNLGMRLEMRTVKYIKPIRAMVERYYRVQGLSIDELDSSGENLPMLLHSLKSEQRKKFEKWVSDRFGVSFTLIDRKGHISLLLKDNETNDTYNLADVGYGYSQVLPILMQIWLNFYENDKNIFNNEKVTIIIEQPELHLHPAFQAKLIDVFAEMLEEAHRIHKDLKIIFETHSETMIQRIGYLIAKGYLSSDDVNILVFDKDKNETNISPKQYTRDGFLQEWPMGFFTPNKRVKRNDNRDR